jgi:hypothetical protein
MSSSLCAVRKEAALSAFEKSAGNMPEGIFGNECSFWAGRLFVIIIDIFQIRRTKLFIFVIVVRYYLHKIPVVCRSKFTFFLAGNIFSFIFVWFPSHPIHRQKTCIVLIFESAYSKPGELLYFNKSFSDIYVVR